LREEREPVLAFARNDGNRLEVDIVKVDMVVFVHQVEIRVYEGESNQSLSGCLFFEEDLVDILVDLVVGRRLGRDEVLPFAELWMRLIRRGVVLNFDWVPSFIADGIRRDVVNVMVSTRWRL
jgi:hypothetical protein